MGRARNDLFVSFLIIAIGSFFCAAEVLGRFQMSWTYELSEYADMARAFSNTGHLTTHFAQPVDLAFLEARGLAAPPWPLTHRFPLFPWIVGLAFSIFGPSDGVIIGVTSLTSSACAVLTYFVGRSFFPKHPHTALAASLAMVAHPIFSVYFPMCGYTEFLFSFLVLASFKMTADLLAAVGEERAGEQRRWVFIGLVAGLAYLARFNFVLFVPVVAAAIGIVRRGRGGLLPRIGAYVAGLAVIAGPWYVYRSLTVGPVAGRDIACNLAEVTGVAFPGFERRIFTVAGVLRDHWREVIGRSAVNFMSAAHWFFVQWEMFWLVPLSLAGGVGIALEGPPEDAKDQRGRARRIFVALYAACFAVQLVAFAPLRVEPQGRYFLWIVPCMVLLGAEAWFELSARLAGRAKPIFWAATIVLLGAWEWYQIAYSAAPVRVDAWEESPPKRDVFPEIAARVPEDAIIISNIGVHIGWYAERTAIDLPSSLEELKSLARDYRARFLVIAFWPMGEVSYRPYWAEFFSARDWEARLGRQIRIEHAWHFHRGVLFEIDPLAAPPPVDERLQPVP